MVINVLSEEVIK